MNNSFASVVQIQKNPRFSIPLVTVTAMGLQVGEEIRCVFWGSEKLLTSFKTKVPASREVCIPKNVAADLTAEDRTYLIELRRSEAVV